MNTAIDPRLIARLSTEFTSLSEHMGILGRDLEALRCQLVTAPPAAATSAAGVPMPAQRPSMPASASGWPVPGAPSGADPAATPRRDAGELSGQGTSSSARTPGAVPVPPAVVAASIPEGGVTATVPQTAAGAPVAPGWGAAPNAPVVGAGQAVPASPVAGGGPGYPQSMPGGAGYGSARAGWMPGGQAGYRVMPPLPQQPRMRPTARPVRAPWWQREGVVSRVLAVAGVGVTLIGVVMLLVLAAQAGFFGPVPRVVVGAVFSGALVTIGMRVHGKVGGRVGAVALAATGIAGGYLDVVAVTTLYGWLNPVLGYGVALGIAAGGVGLAVQWRSQALAVMVVLGAALLSPVVTTEVALLAFLIVLQIAAVPVQLGRDWPYLHIVRTVPAVLATLVAVAMAGLGDASRGHRYEVLAAAIAVAVVGLAGTVLAVRQRAGDIAASLTFAAATVPLLAAPAMFERGTAVLISTGFAVVLLALAAAPWASKLVERVRIPGHLAVVAAVAGAFALLETCLGVTRAQTLPVALFLVALGFLGAGGQQRSRVAAGIGGAFGVSGMLAFVNDAGPATLSDQWYAEERLGISTALSAVSALAVLVAAFWCARRLGLVARESDATAVAVVGGLAGLYAVTALTVSLGVATGRHDGFLAGHGIATVVWMGAATSALLFGLRRLSRAPQAAKVALAAGLLVTGAALAKLFLFDLATLDGLFRAAAFLVVGVLLLLVGTRYARAFAEADEPAQPD